MNDAKKKQTFSGMTLSEVAGLLREVADRLDGAPPAETARVTLPVEAFRKFKLGITQDSGGYAVKLKLKVPAPQGAGPDAETLPENAGDDVRPKYKHLKKRMKKSFKTVTDSLLADALPPADVVADFLKQSEEMIAWPGYGDEYYDAYDAACRRLRSAFEADDVDACKAAGQALNRLKKECHDRYK